MYYFVLCTFTKLRMELINSKRYLYLLHLKRTTLLILFRLNDADSASYLSKFKKAFLNFLLKIYFRQLLQKSVSGMNKDYRPTASLVFLNEQ